jgi:hypothetical protein
LTGTASEESSELGCVYTMLFYAEMKAKRLYVHKESCSCSLEFFVRGFVHEALCLLMLLYFQSTPLLHGLYIIVSTLPLSPQVIRLT